MKKFLSIIAFALVSMSANAQLSKSVSEELHTHLQEYDVVRSKNYHRIYAGYLNRWVNTSKHKFDDDEVLPAQSISAPGASLGWTVGMPVSKTLPLYLETGLRFGFAMYDDENEFDGDEHASVESYFLSVPVNITYRYQIGNRIFIAPFAGFYLGGSVHEQTHYTNYDYHHYFKHDGVTPDFGMQLGVNLDLKGFHLGVDWQPSFLNFGMECKGDGGDNCHTKLKGHRNMLNVSLGFVLQKKKKVKKN